MSRLQIVSQKLAQRHALVVGVISEHGALEIGSDRYEPHCDLIELRLDALGSGEDVCSFARECSLPILITSRRPDEGGASAFSADERLAQYRDLLPYAQLLDTELRSFSEMTELLAEAREAGVIIVGSYHDFEKTPSLENLLALDHESPDIFKVATQVHSPDDLKILEELLKKTAPSSVMGMGELGVAARPMLAKAGSILNYGYLGDSPTAPGQWSAKLLKKALQGHAEV